MQAKWNTIVANPNSSFNANLANITVQNIAPIIANRFIPLFLLLTNHHLHKVHS